MKDKDGVGCDTVENVIHVSALRRNVLFYSPSLFFDDNLRVQWLGTNWADVSVSCFVKVRFPHLLAVGAAYQKWFVGLAFCHRLISRICQTRRQFAGWTLQKQLLSVSSGKEIWRTLLVSQRFDRVDGSSFAGWEEAGKQADSGEDTGGHKHCGERQDRPPEELHCIYAVAGGQHTYN